MLSLCDFVKDGAVSCIRRYYSRLQPDDESIDIDYRDVLKQLRVIFSNAVIGITFLKNFTLKSGSLKEIAKLYGVSYPTVRLRLDKLIQKIELGDQQEEEPFQTFIKGLAVDSKIDLETAKMIIEKYKKEKEEKEL